MQCDGEEPEDDVVEYVDTKHGFEVEGEESEGDEYVSPMKVAEAPEPEPEPVTPADEHDPQPQQQKPKDENNPTQDVKKTTKNNKLLESIADWGEGIILNMRGSGAQDRVIELADTFSNGQPLPQHLNKLRINNSNLYSSTKELYKNIGEHQVRVLESFSKLPSLASSTSSTLASLEKSSRNLSSVSLQLTEAIASLPPFWNVYNRPDDRKKIIIPDQKS
eukprot:TRINITY_DN2351_c3_g1_i2.p1 TRINITY_DN2351_c3_g1~~TRINITY_DN2351_c3_g1_i2.p1  ORF type:complete len:234 (+),score=56.96 TRINITY_DN2351_c3_g1_i2:45-704(+)